MKAKEATHKVVHTAVQGTKAAVGAVLAAGRATEAAARVSHDIDNKAFGLAKDALKGTLKFAFKQAHKAYSKLEAKHGEKATGYGLLSAIFAASVAIPAAGLVATVAPLTVFAGPAALMAVLGTVSYGLAKKAVNTSKAFRQTGIQT
jgi:hypothetical protein